MKKHNMIINFIVLCVLSFILSSCQRGMTIQRTLKPGYAAVVKKFSEVQQILTEPQSRIPFGCIGQNVSIYPITPQTIVHGVGIVPTRDNTLIQVRL